ncbi:hypothetical protein CFC21_054517 [Triticum aestivum]|uniref:non-specific serine/threonine protein kinase n=2 Tax=Triticum aestivum TaxID=4565 RepID=A0A9R1GEW4_WHEAT|nr:hypothetical protein CFC21_054517 [Triticum aestivum]
MLLCYLMWSLHLPRATAWFSFTYNFNHPHGYNAQDFSYQGDAYFNTVSQAIQLTRAGGSPNIRNSVGRALLVQPVPLWDTITGELTQFNTSFTFRINVSSEITGQGFAFFIGSYPWTSMSDPLENGQNLGLFKGNLSTVATGDKQIVAVEFDTFFNVGVDTSGSHMGIDVNSIVSKAYTNVTVPGKNLTSGLPMTCNITYSNETQTLAAILKIGDATYSVNTSVDLRLMPSVVTIGFSGATGAADELYQIMSWKFRSTFNPHARKSYESPPPAPKILLCTRKKRYRSLAGGIGHIGYCKLALAANKFAQENKLGQGGSASVYRGELANPSRAVAIKRFKPATSSEGRKAFEDELRIASRLRHRNLVELIGWCYYGQRNLVEFICWWRDDRYTRLFLVYELLPQGSLDQHLHEGKSWLPWSKRYDIILDLGSALQYLHVDCEQHKQCVVHGDIKSSNMLLDPSYGAKLGDFGLARSVHQGTGAHTTDVVQEMVSGRDPTVRLNDRPPLTSWVKSLYHGNALLEAADVRLIGGESSVGRQQMKRALLVGLLCVHQDPSCRPSIIHTMDALRSERLELDITPLAPMIPLLMP